MQLGDLHIHHGDVIRFDSFLSGRETQPVHQTTDGVLFIYAQAEGGELIVPVAGLGQRRVEAVALNTDMTEQGTLHPD